MTEPMMAGLTMPDVLNLIVQHGEMADLLERAEFDSQDDATQARVILDLIRSEA